MYGTHFLDAICLVQLDGKLRQWGRRLLGWPAGAPGVAVLGELGWAPLAMEAKRLQYGLFARLSSAGAHSARRRLAARVFQFALHCPRFWAHSTAQGLRIDGVVLPSSFGIGPGVCMGQVGSWNRRHMHCAQRQYRDELTSVPSLAEYATYQPRFSSGSNIHYSRLPFSALRAWTLARCGQKCSSSPNA